MAEMEEFEDSLQQAFLRRPAPPGLRQRILDQRNRRRSDKIHRRVVFWQKLAACFLVVAVLGGLLTWRHLREQRRGAAARREVLTALRITNHALQQIHAQLAARDRELGEKP
jgi:hypothetical protein